MVAALESVGDAAILTACGWFLHSKGFMTKAGRKLLAEISQHVTFPLLLFTSILYCEQDGGTYRGAETKCPDMFATITASWIVLLWPFFITAMGVVVGKLMATMSKAEDSFKFAAMAAVAFGNSTGLPLTLVSIIHGAADSSSPLSRSDPAIYVSIYLIFNPILQWSVGSWLLEPPSQSPADEGCNLSNQAKVDIQTLNIEPLLDNAEKQVAALLNDEHRGASLGHANKFKTKQTDIDVPEIMRIIYKQLAQPAIIASICGLFIACIKPLHKVLVDVGDQDGDAPMEWFFEALYTMGKAAIPVSSRCLSMLVPMLNDALSSLSLCAHDTTNDRLT
jgi:predicted permease